MYCMKCGIESGAGADFCGACGAQLRPSAAASVTMSEYAAPTNPFRDRGRASFGHRFGGYLIDQAINFAGAFALGFALALALLPESYTQDDLDSVQGAVSLITIAVVFIYKWVADSLGGTLGKIVVGIRVVDDTSYEAPGLASGFVRTLVSIASGIPVGLGYLWAAWDDEGKTWHDKAAGTMVVRR